MRQISSRYRLERTNGCRIEDTWTYKGMQTLILQNEKLRISILLDKGGEIFEILYKPFDLNFMYRSPKGIQNPIFTTRGPTNKDSTFFDCYFGGWQEIFPSGSGGCIYRGAEFGLHGEVALLPWDYEILEDTPEKIIVRLITRTVRSPYLLIKDITLNKGESIIWFSEQIINESDEQLQFMWGQHPAFGGPFIGSDTRLDLPSCTIQTHSEQFSLNSIFPASAVFDWPNARNKFDQEVDLRFLLSNSENQTDMLYVSQLEAGWAALTNTEIGVGIGFTWDINTFPYLWIWNESQGTSDYPWYGCAKILALEPFTSLPGDGKFGLLEAIENNTAISIKPHGLLSTEFAVIVYESTSPVNSINSTGNVIFE